MTEKKGDKSKGGDEPQDLSRRRFLKVAGTSAAVVASGGTKVPTQVAAAAAPVIREIVGKGVVESIRGLIPKELVKILNRIDRDDMYQMDWLIGSFRKGEYKLDNLEKLFQTREFPKGKYGLPDLGFIRLLEQACEDSFKDYYLFQPGIDELTIKDFFSKQVYDYIDEDYDYEGDDENYNYETENGEPVLIPKRKQEDIDADLQSYFKNFLRITGSRETDRILDVKKKMVERKVAFYEEYLNVAENIFIEGLFDKEQVKYLFNNLVSLGHDSVHSNYLAKKRVYPKLYVYLKDIETPVEWVTPYIRERKTSIEAEKFIKYQERIFKIVKKLDKKLYELETEEREKWEKEQEEQRKKQIEEEEKKRKEREKKRGEEERKKREEQNENMGSRENFKCSVKEIREEGWFSGLDSTFVISHEGWESKQSFNIVDVRKYFEQILSQIYNKKVSGGYGESLETYKNGFLMRYLSDRNKETIKVVTSNLEIIEFLRQKIKENVYLEIPNRSYEDPNRQDTDEELEEILSQNARGDE